MRWNYRLIVHPPEGPGTKGWVGLHEVYYDDEGKPRAHTSHPDIVFDIGATEEETRANARQVIERIMRCVDEPLLDARQFKEKASEPT
jgi:hypothetical protein